MKRKAGTLDAISIPDPCPTDWDSMTGNRRQRFCQQCSKNVYNLSAMTRDEAEALIARLEGRLCARVERDEAGVIWTDDLRAAPQLISRRASPVAAALVTALIGLGGNVMAITPSANAPVAVHLKSNQDDRAPQPQGGTGTIAGVVADTSGGVITNAKVTLINQATGQPCGTTASDENGSFNFASLAEGTYTIRVESQNFRAQAFENIEIRASASKRIEFNLSAAPSGMGGAVAIRQQPLRPLYHISDLIVVARLGRSAPVKRTETNEMMKATLEVTSVIKGDNRRSRLTVYHWGWGQDKLFPGGLKTGDTALFFLKPRDAGDGFELSNYSFGVKRLAPADLSVYQQRLEELNAIEKAETPGTAAIVEWLVRCVEQRATRWEGAYDLAQSVELGADRSDAEAGDGPAEPQAAADTAVISPAASGEPASSSDAQTAPAAPACSRPAAPAYLAVRISEEQKGRLQAALFKIDALTEEDMELVTLVLRWQDPRLVPFLLDQLRRLEADPPRLAARLMGVVGAALHDEEVKALAEEYVSNASYEDLAAEAAADRQEAEAAEPSEAEAEDGAEASDEADDAPKDAATARQERSLMLQRFIALAEKKRASQRLDQ